MTLLAAERIDEGLEAETTGVEGLDRVPPKPLLLRPVSKLSLLIVREEGEIVVVLRVPLRHYSPLSLSHEALTLDFCKKKNLTLASAKP